MRFGERLARERWIPWAGHYINFELLKRKIKECVRAADARDLEEGKDEFEKELDGEIEKAPFPPTCDLRCLSCTPASLHACMHARAPGEQVLGSQASCLHAPH
jgi:hypothetical protein